MWRKIHSNRDPRDTLFSEIRKEFSFYFTRANTTMRQLLDAYPKLAFGIMIVLLITSAVLSFTVFRHPETKPVMVAAPINPVGEGFSKILEAATKIKEGIRLKTLIDSISSKKQLTTQDSLALEKALDDLQKIQH